MRSLSANSIYRAELDLVSRQVPLDALRGRRVLVTGASGLVGSAVVDLLLHLNRLYDACIGVVAAGRTREKLVRRFGMDGQITFAAYDDVLAGMGSGGFDCAVLAASPASPEIYVNDPGSVVKANTSDVSSILSSIRSREGKNVVYVSSSEVYGDLVAPEGGYAEDEFGEIDDSSARSCYAISKRRAEVICRGFADSGLHVVVVRPGHVYGPTASRQDRRVSSAWAYDAAFGKDIVMKSDGRQLRSYVHCLDCASAILVAMCCGKAGEPYNVSNRDSVISIRDMAEILSDAGGVRLLMELPTDSERRAFNPMINSSLNALKLERLGWTGMIGAKRGFSETVAVLREDSEAAA